MLSKTKRKIPNLVIAAILALLAHVLLFLLIGTPNWLINISHKTPSQSAEIEVTIQKAAPMNSQLNTENKTQDTENIATDGQATQQELKTPEETTEPLPSSTSVQNGATESQVEAETNSEKTISSKTVDIATKSPLLDLSHFSLSPSADDNALKNIFSKELREKIVQSKQAQMEYLKGVQKTENYPITEDADGTRYVNIKGVCWRMPKEGSKDSWAIVFDGCGIKEKAFHFELNISPSMITNELLGPDSPFTMEK